MIFAPRCYRSPTMELGVDIFRAGTSPIRRNVPYAGQLRPAQRTPRSVQPARSSPPQRRARTDQCISGIRRRLQDSAPCPSTGRSFESHLHAVWLASMEYGLGFHRRSASIWAMTESIRASQTDLAECRRAEATRERAHCRASNDYAGPPAWRALWYRQWEEERLRMPDRARWRDLLPPPRDKGPRPRDHGQLRLFAQEKADANQRHRSAVSQLNC